ncbi:MAG: alpha-1,4-glucan--maltose-1-phosphate maltosyltransferase [Desulfobacterales bacterium]|nr:MAG: alpha-1,4-glucan--maltose-1-phosphate maltosyltransferase [Desulfobacterales bacterium]
MESQEGGRRVIIEGVKPEIDGGRFPIKRATGDKVQVEADIFTDGHEAVACVLLYRKEDDPDWSEVPLTFLVNDRWRGYFVVRDIGRYRYTLQGWVDRFQTWRKDLKKKMAADQDVSVDLLTGAALVVAASSRAADGDCARLLAWAEKLQSGADPEKAVRLALEEDLAELMARYPDRRRSTTYAKELAVVVDRPRARFSTWYEMFPRSCTDKPGSHGTFKDCEARLPHIAQMGFDVLYLPPIHPIGHTHRKGRNNAPQAGPNDPGSPWAIGSRDGGHMSVHPRLGTLEDFRHLLARAQEYGLEIALDLAFQCTPDHPYVKEHPQWFRWRPDGTIQYAENPPKKYEDIYPFDFESDQWQNLWNELHAIVRFWIDQGVRIFRVDNPHTKPFAFWEWLIAVVKKEFPEVIFLAEAFTRPKVMYRLAKLGFTQSYTYFAWRNTKPELVKYFSELSQTAVCEYFRPNLWPNTPDILTEYLQMGARPAFMIRLILAATLGANYGIYGPAFELCENTARDIRGEEYLHSEKYQLRDWDINHPDSLKDFIARVNRIRRENPALQNDGSLRFHPVDNEQLICFSKHTEDLADIVLVVVNLDPRHTHTGWLELPLAELGLDPHQPYQMHDLLSDARYLWYSGRNYLEVNPHVVPAHIFRLRRRVRTERDFDYFM